MVRRRDMIQPAPGDIPLESSSVYRVSFQGEQCARVIRFEPVDEGINGLETVLQSKNKNTSNSQNSTSVKAGEQCPVTNNTPTESTYRSDFGHRARGIETTTPSQHSSKQSKEGTDYRDHYHSWVSIPSPGFLIDRVGFHWKPKPAVYIPPDPRKYEPLSSNTSYREQFSSPVPMSVPDMTDKQLPLARRSEITQSRLLSSFNGVVEQLPTSLYRASFVPQQGADRWAERNVRQHTCPVIHRTGPNQQIDDLYWANADTQPYKDYRKAVFLKAKGGKETGIEATKIQELFQEG
ncbi:hypothetical protein D915_000935 [Fasciola hepatica]|uniref:Uncharacterized protein n=1 Tax=Fasciola hepatica TaxID=6192 RepID=A0A4E0S303_FASHE|nr:hypothetical protein D915_000935 [Fasciola hepatica]